MPAGLRLFISQMVLKEVRRGDTAFASARLAQIAGIPLLSDVREAVELARRLLADRIVPGFGGKAAAELKAFLVARTVGE